MKFLATTLLFLLFAVPALAQPTFTESDVRAHLGASQDVRAFLSNGPANQIQALVNKSGANQTWDFTTLDFDAGDVQKRNIYNSPPAGSPGSTQPPYNAADYVVEQDIGPDSVSYSFQEFRNEGLYYLGGISSMGGTETRTSTTPAILFTPLPISYNTAWTTNATTTTTQNGTTFTVQEKRDNTVDGYGTVILPSGTFNVLRLKSVITATTAGFTTTQTIYSWFDEGFFYLAGATDLTTPFGKIYTASYNAEGTGGGGGGNPPQSAPANLMPTDGTTDTSTSLTLSWDATADTDSYDLQVATDGNFKSGVATFSALVVDESGLSGTSFDVSGLDEATTYFWRVRGVNANGDGPWSSAQDFTTETSLAAPGAITLDAPNDGADDQATTLTLSWQTQAAADQYQLQVATEAAFSSTVFDDATLTTTSQEISGLAEGTMYFWRVRGSNAAGDGPWSDTRSFTTMTSDPTAVERVGEGIPEQFALAANYPNPFNPQTTIRYAVSSTAHVRLAVYDALGREVAVLVNEGQPAGTYEATFEGIGLPSGVYLYRMTAGSFTETKRMLLLK